MIYRKLKHADIEVSGIAMGCWQFAGGDMWGDQEDRDSINAVHAALDIGITLFDTAEGYGAGKSEEVLGAALEGKRSAAIVATKASGPTYEHDELTAACENSLRRLKTDYIDVYQLHWPRSEAVDPESIFATVEELKRRGKIRSFGVCNYGSSDLGELLSAGTIATDQLAYGLLWRGIEVDIVPKLAENGIGVLAYSSLIHGLLSGKYRTVDELPKGRARSLHFSGTREGVRHDEPGEEALTNKTLDSIRKICDQTEISMVDAAFGWTLHQNQVASVLAGARSVEQVEQNARIADIDFTPKFLAALTTATDELKEAFGGKVDMWDSPGRIK